MRHLFWFRHDLRLHDNAGLHAACAAGEVVPCVVLDDFFLKNNPAIGPNRCALFLRAVVSLAKSLEAKGARLIVRHGPPEREIPKLMKEAGTDGVYLNRDYEPYAIARDKHVEKAVRAAGGTYTSHKDLVIFESGEVLTQAGNPYTIFTQYRKTWLATEPRPSVVPMPRTIPFPRDAKQLASENVEPDSITPESELPVVTEESGRKRLAKFLDTHVLDYETTRNQPAIDGTSRLSPHLKYGTLSPRTVVAAAEKLMGEMRKPESKANIATFISEIVWRDFFFQIFVEFPHVATGAFRPMYNALKWSTDAAHLQAWKDGRTGYPIVDAGMRQLKAIGWMHNRVRMITGSFLCKDLLIGWREGEKHFSRLLIDGEPAVNNGNWQWVAGTGTDASPYFRIFNPTSQGQRFDPDGAYVRQWVPELADVPDDAIHTPWEAGLLCPDYPAPIVQHDLQRVKALEMYKEARP